MADYQIMVSKRWVTVERGDGLPLARCYGHHHEACVRRTAQEMGRLIVRALRADDRRLAELERRRARKERGR